MVVILPHQCMNWQCMETMHMGIARMGEDPIPIIESSKPKTHLLYQTFRNLMMIMIYRFANPIPLTWT